MSSPRPASRVALKRAGQELDERQIPLAGLVAAFVFAVQMLNFPVASGTSGHLLGGVLAAVLVGPWVGALCVSVVLVVQALLFADGGLSALGLNIVNMALVGAIGGYVVFRARARGAAPSPLQRRRRVGHRRRPVGRARVDRVHDRVRDRRHRGRVRVRPSRGAMVGVHTLIGIGEGVITALTVSAVLATRPDLVYGARDLAADRRAPAAPVEARTMTPRLRFGVFLALGLVARRGRSRSS